MLMLLEIFAAVRLLRPVVSGYTEMRGIYMYICMTSLGLKPSGELVLKNSYIAV